MGMPRCAGRRVHVRGCTVRKSRFDIPKVLRTHRVRVYHTWSVKPFHGHQALHTARQGTLVEKNATVMVYYGIFLRYRVGYQQYVSTVKLNPDKVDGFKQTFGTLTKLYPTLWICCTHYNCMTVYDVTSSNDTQRNNHLTEHHTLGVKPLHGHQDLHTVRQGTLTDKKTTVMVYYGILLRYRVGYLRY